MFKRGKTALSTVAMAATLAVTALVTSPPAQAASTPKDPDGIFVVTTNHEDLSAGILREAARKPAYREQAFALAERWQSDLSAGQSINLGAMTEGRSPADGAAAASRLKDDLKALSSGSTPSSGTDPTAQTVTPMSSNLNPNGFPVAGFPNNTYLNRPGVSGDSSPWKGWDRGHVEWCVQEVPAGVAGACGADGR